MLMTEGGQPRNYWWRVAYRTFSSLRRSMASKFAQSAKTHLHCSRWSRRRAVPDPHNLHLQSWPRWKQPRLLHQREWKAVPNHLPQTLLRRPISLDDVDWIREEELIGGRHCRKSEFSAAAQQPTIHHNLWNDVWKMLQKGYFIIEEHCTCIFI